MSNKYLGALMAKYDNVKFELDVHTHTIASGHAYSTINEMVAAAEEKGLRLLGITEHAPAMPGSCHEMYFHNLYVVPRLQGGVEVLLGAEVNLLDTEGRLDLRPSTISRLDLCIVGIHVPTFVSGTKTENTDALVKVMSRPDVHIISHPGDGTAELDFEPIVRAAAEHHTLLEINNSSARPERNKPQAISNMLELLRLHKEYDLPVILGSDAHVHFDVARFNEVIPLLEEADFPPELVINTSVEAFKSYLNLKS